jgi:hypothetical protein
MTQDTHCGNHFIRDQLKTDFPLRICRLNLLLPFFVALVLAVTAVPVNADEGTVISVASGTDWTNALAQISRDGNGTSTENPKVYTLDIQGEVSVPGVRSPSISGNYKTVRLTGSGTLSLSSSGSIFRIGGIQKLIIDGPTLKGRRSNNASLVYANGGAVELRNGAITGNSATDGGGGVSVAAGSFFISGGAISGNSATDGGGGVSVAAGSFFISGGAITGNSTTDGGGGVSVAAGSFFISGGAITGNSATDGGGGVSVSAGAFNMSGGTITGNSTTDGAGGVSVSAGSFFMSDGIISGNSTSNGAGGVSIINSTKSTKTSGGAIFTKTGGFIYGDTDNIVGNGNGTDNTAAAKTGINGNAVLYINYDSDNSRPDYYYRNETLGNDASGNISAKAELLPTKSGETLNNWTKR